MKIITYGHHDCRGKAQGPDKRTEDDKKDEAAIGWEEVERAHEELDRYLKCKCKYTSTHDVYQYALMLHMHIYIYMYMYKQTWVPSWKP